MRLDERRAAWGTVALLATLILLDNVGLAALTPLLAETADEFGLSSASLGLLVAAYTVGGVLVAVPAALLGSRTDVRVTVVGGALVLAAGTSAFAVADDAVTIVVARMAQGLGSVVSWVGCATWITVAVPSSRRSEALGYAGAAGLAGVVVGPVVGGVAAAIGRAPVFLALSGTIATVSFVVLAALRPPAVAASKQSPEAIGPLLRDPRTRLGLVVLLLGGLVGGALALVVPVDLARFDVAVVVAFFTAAAIAQTVATPLIGRWADSRGPLVPVAAGAAAIIPSLMLLGMVGAGPTFVGAAFVAVVVAGAAFWAPGTVLTLGSRRDALPGLALAVGTVAWLGSYSAGTLAAGVVMDAGARAAAVWMLIVPAAGAWWLAVRGRWLPR